MTASSPLRRFGSLLRSGGLGDLLVAQVVSVVSSVVVTFATAYFMGPEARGSLAYVLGLSNLLGIVGFGSYHIGATQAERTNDLSGRLVGLRAAAYSAGAMLFLGLLVSAALWGRGDSVALVAVAAHAAVGGTLVSLNFYLMRLGQALGNDAAFRNAWLIQGVGFAVTGCFLAASLKEPYPVVWAWWLCLLASSAYMLRTIDWRSARPAAGLRQVLLISWAAHAATLGIQVLYRFNIVALGLWSTTAEVGLYSVAAPIAEVTWLVSEAFSLLAYRRALSSERHSVALAALHLVGTVGAGLVVLLVAWLFLPLVLPEFDGAVVLVAVLLPGVIVQGSARVALAKILGRRPGIRERVIGALAALSALVYIPAAIIGGALGVAIASSVLYCALGSVVIAVNRRESRTGVSVG